MDRMYPVFIIIVLFVSSLSIDAATKPKDVYGWASVRWGMTDKEVQSTLGDQVEKRKVRHDEKDKMYTGLELKQVDMGGTRLRASLWMAEDSKGLTRIVFVPKESPDKYEWAETFINLEEFLVENYGVPDVEETSNDPGTSADRKWKFPSTEIELSYLRLGDSELLLLVFSQTDNSKNQ